MLNKKVKVMLKKESESYVTTEPSNLVTAANCTQPNILNSPLMMMMMLVTTKRRARTTTTTRTTTMTTMITTATTTTAATTTTTTKKIIMMLTTSLGVFWTPTSEEELGILEAGCWCWWSTDGERDASSWWWQWLGIRYIELNRNAPELICSAMIMIMNIVMKTETLIK